MKENKVNWVGVAINIVIPILAIFLAIVFSEVQSKVGWKLLTLSLGLIFSIYLSMLYFVNLKLRFSDNEYIDIITMQKNTLEEAHLKFRDLIIATEGNFISSENLAHRQSSDDVHEVWVVSSDISIDTENEIFFNLINKNIGRGVKYKYFIPRTSSNLQCVDVLNKELINNKSINFTYLGDDYYKLSPNINYVIFNPRGRNENRQCYLGVTLSINQDYNIKISDAAAKDLVGSLLEIESRNEKSTLPSSSA